jgi:hypothetical protein
VLSSRYCCTTSHHFFSYCPHRKTTFKEDVKSRSQRFGTGAKIPTTRDLCANLAEQLRFEMQIPFDRQTVGAAHRFELSETEVAKLNVPPFDQTKERVFAIELGDEPRPSRRRREELGAHHWIGNVFRAVKRR